MGNITLIKTTIKEEYGKKAKNYASIILNESTEVGYVTDEGIFLRLYNTGNPFGVINNIGVKGGKFAQYCQFVERNWDAIYDRYDVLVKSIQNLRKN